mgnify:CR=1 FL=1
MPADPLPTCDICDQVRDLRLRAEQTYRLGKRSGFGPLGEEAGRLESRHPKCYQCGWYFGGGHGGKDAGRGRCHKCEGRYARV